MNAFCFALFVLFILWKLICLPQVKAGVSDCKESAMQETRVGFLGQKDPLEKGMATHSNITDCRIPWTEEPGRLQSRGLRVGHD